MIALVFQEDHDKQGGENVEDRVCLYGTPCALHFCHGMLCKSHVKRYVCL